MSSANGDRNGSSSASLDDIFSMFREKKDRNGSSGSQDDDIKSMFLDKKDRNGSSSVTWDDDPDEPLNRDKEHRQNAAGTNRETSGAAQRKKTTRERSPIFPDTSPGAPPPNSGGSGLFGSSTQQQAAPSGGSGLFGGGTQQNNSSGSSLFGGNAQQPNTQTGGLFGSSVQQPQQQQNTGTTNSLFGGAQQQPLPNQGAGGSLFGGAQPQLQPTSSLFGSRPAQAQPTGSSSLFGNTQAQQQQQQSNAGPSSFGQQQQQQQPSLFGAAQAASLNKPTPFSGRLSLGQGAYTQNAAAVPAVKIDVDGLRPTTRYEELSDSMKAELDKLDWMIDQQENFHSQIQAIMPSHGQGIASLGPDVEFVKDKVEAVETALSSDAHGVHAQNRIAVKDVEDVKRCQRNITNLNLPQGYQYAKLGYTSSTSLYGSQGPQGGNGQLSHPGHRDNNGNNIQDSSGATYAADLVGEYFVPLAAEMQTLIGNYMKNLAEIEQHMQVIEGSAVEQAQQLAQRKAGNMDSQSGSNATVRELADTLRGFEASILSVAGTVGECRGGINELVMGRINGRF